MANVIVGCRLPHGIVLEHQGKTVTLNGAHASPIIGADYSSNEVDSEFWDAWLAEHKEFPPVVSGAIFVAKNAQQAVAVAKELKDEEVGFEPMRTDGKDRRAKGVKKVDKD